MNTTESALLLSFVIPVYNVERYLEECVESILCQNTESFQIVLVDDGSTDASREICDRYAARYSNIQVIHKANGGLSSARNAGIAAAEGKYVTVVDSDDKICSGSVAELLHWIQTENADLCFLHADRLFPNNELMDLNEEIVRSELHGKSKEAAIRHLATRPKYPGCAWAKLYRRSFLNDHDLHFPYDTRYSEDLGFVRDCILCADSFDVLDVPFYLYRQSRQGSITNKKSAKSFYDLLLFVTESVDKLTVNKKPINEISRFAMSFAAYEYAALLHLYHKIPKADKKQALEKMAAYRWVLRFANNKRIKAVSLLCNLFGMRFTAFLAVKYRKAKMRI